MEKTVKRQSIAFSKKDLESLSKLCAHLGETPSSVIKRAISFLEYNVFYKEHSPIKLYLP